MSTSMCPDGDHRMKMARKESQRSGRVPEADTKSNQVGIGVNLGRMRGL